MNKKFEPPSNVLENGKISQTQLNEIVSMALESLKTLMVDYETPIDIRMNAALIIFENFGVNNRKNNDALLIHSIEKNAHNINKNSRKLSGIETLLSLIAQSNNVSPIPNDVYHQKRGRVIIH